MIPDGRSEIRKERTSKNNNTGINLKGHETMLSYEVKKKEHASQMGGSYGQNRISPKFPC